METAVYLAIAGGVFLCCPFSHLDKIWDEILSVSMGYLTYSYKTNNYTPYYGNGQMVLHAESKVERTTSGCFFF